MATQRNHGFSKAFIASGAIATRRVLAIDAADNTVKQAAAATDPLIGVSDDTFGAAWADGDRVDCIMEGIVELEAGAAVAKGNKLTVNAAGRVIPTAAGTDSIIGMALDAAAADGDIISVKIDLS